MFAGRRKAITVILLTLSTWSTKLDAQTMEEMAVLEREAMELVASERAQRFGKSEMTESRFSFTAPGGTYYELAFMQDGAPVYRKTSNLKESTMIRATQARHDLAVTGREIEIGLWDNAPAFDHPEFSHRLHVPAQPGSPTPSSHATHVAGTLAASGLDLEATGLAPEARLSSYDWRFDYIEMYAEAQEGLRVSNHSYSLAAGWEEIYRDGSFVWNYKTHGPRFGEYGVMAWFWDDVMSQNPHYLAVKAAGNEAGQGPGANVGHHHDGFAEPLHFDEHETDCGSGYGCLGSISASKNALVVGALSADGVRVADFSSRGPTLDGRIKPDVVSAGTGVYSSVGTDGYGVSSGTSMAAPTVAGSIALMIDLERRLYHSAKRFSSSTLKAIVIHSADDLGNPGPDYQYGWGRVNIQAALDLMLDSRNGNVVLAERNVDDEVVIEGFATGGKFRTTLSWIDPIGPNPNTIVDKTAPVLIEDVDIRLEKDGNVYSPFILDSASPEAVATTGINVLDNVEQIVVPDLDPGPVRIRIRRKRASAEPLTVSLVVSGLQENPFVPTSTGETKTFDTSISVYPSPVRLGDTVRIQGRLAQRQSVRVEIVDLGGRVVAILSEGTTGRLDAHWSVPDYLSAGMYFLRIRGESIDETFPIVMVR